MSNSANEIKALAAFKEGYELLGASRIIPMGGDKLPRAVWAKATAYAIAKLAKESGDNLAASASVLDSVVGNSSQLGARLFKEGYLSEASGEVTADALLAKLRAKLEPAAETPKA